MSISNPIISQVILSTLSSLHSCQQCGGICQICDDMITDGQAVMTRLSGEDKGIIKECPYCGKQAIFKSITRNWIS